MIKIHDLEKIYRTEEVETIALNKLSFQVNEGEFVAVMGPSGCGKSTTLRMVAGLEKISNGTIKIGGRVVNDMEPKDRGIAMVFQTLRPLPAYDHI